MNTCVLFHQKSFCISDSVYFLWTCFNNDSVLNTFFMVLAVHYILLHKPISSCMSASASFLSFFLCVYLTIILPLPVPYFLADSFITFWMLHSHSDNYHPPAAKVFFFSFFFSSPLLPRSAAPPLWHGCVFTAPVLFYRPSRCGQGSAAPAGNQMVSWLRCSMPG